MGVRPVHIAGAHGRSHFQFSRGLRRVAGLGMGGWRFVGDSRQAGGGFGFGVGCGWMVAAESLAGRGFVRRDSCRV